MWNQAEEFFRKNKHIGPLVQKWGSCTIRPIKKSQYFRDLVEAIANQQLSGKAASTIFGRVKILCKTRISPEAILNLSDLDLRTAGLSFAKVKYIKDLASRVKSGVLDLDKLPNLTDEEIVKELVAVKGIGRWTAEMFLMFGLARPDVFPVDDLGIKKGFEKVTGRKWDKIKSARLAEKTWSPYRTVASWYLWRSMENR